MDLPVEIWMRILEIAMKDDILECCEHRDITECDELCEKECPRLKSTWTAVRTFTHICQNSRAAADKLSLTNTAGSELWTVPMPIYLVSKVLGSQSSGSPSTEDPLRHKVLAVGGSMSQGLDLRDHFMMLHLGAHILRDVRWKPLKGAHNSAHVGTLHRLLEHEEGRAQITAEIDLLMRADTILLSMPNRGGNTKGYKQIRDCIWGMADVWDVDHAGVEWWL